MKTINSLCVLIVLFCLYSCDDILEEDISGDKILISYPLNGIEIESNVVNFQWEEVDGADDYRLQVYASSNQMMLDTLVNSRHFSQSITPGTYQWRVRGENFAYKTEYSFPATFSVIETDDMANVTLILNNPALNSYGRLYTPSFSWTSVNHATSYVFQLINVTAGNNLIHEEAGINGTTFTPAMGVIQQDGQYQWKVKAINTDNDTESQYSVRAFYIDSTAPNQPQNSSPVNDGTTGNNMNVNFEWTAPQDTGIINSPITYTIEIATDTSFANIIQAFTTSTTRYTYNFATDGIYYWRVKSVDEAGNQGSYSTYFKLTIN